MLKSTLLATLMVLSCILSSTTTAFADNPIGVLTFARDNSRRIYLVAGEKYTITEDLGGCALTCLNNGQVFFFRSGVVEVSLYCR
jgi:hypothetical protein